MGYNKEEIAKVLKAKRSGSKGWMVGFCPYCGKLDHLAYLIGNISSFHCLKCGKHGLLWELLKHIGRSDLATNYKNVNLNQPLKKFLIKELEEVDYKMPYQSLPIGFKRIYDHDYLNSRGWTSDSYLKYPVGISKLDPIYKHDYLIFPIEEEGENKGYLARTTRDNKWVKEQNERAKITGEKKYLRYRNSVADFSKYLYGINEIKNTITVIIVEGIFDKFNVDKQLNLFEIEEIKCVCSFGKKISSAQIKRLQDKGIYRVILLYDPDAMKASKEYSLKLNDYFEVEIGYIYNDKDPGEMEQDQLFEILSSTENVVSFKIGKLEKLKLL